MVTLTSTHARRRHTSVTEALLWAVWLAARWTGVAALIGALRNVHPLQFSVPNWLSVFGHATTRLAEYVHGRLHVHLESAAIAVVNAINGAHVSASRDQFLTRALRRLPILVVVGAALANLAYLYLR